MHSRGLGVHWGAKICTVLSQSIMNCLKLICGATLASSLKVTMCSIATHGECRPGHTQSGVDFPTGCNTETVTESCSNSATQATYGMKLSAGASSDSATLEYYAVANSDCTGTATYTLPINTTCSVQDPFALEICQQDCDANSATGLIASTVPALLVMACLF